MLKAYSLNEALGYYKVTNKIIFPYLNLILFRTPSETFGIINVKLSNSFTKEVFRSVEYAQLMTKSSSIKYNQ